MSKKLNGIIPYCYKGQFASPYVGMGNSPVTGIDPDGGECDLCLLLMDRGYNVLREVVVTLQEIFLESYQMF